MTKQPTSTVDEGREREAARRCPPRADASSPLEGHRVRRELRRQPRAVAEAVADAPELPLLAAAPSQHAAGAGQGHAVVRSCKSSSKRGPFRRTDKHLLL